MPIRSKLEWVTMMPSHSPLAILAVSSLRRSRARSSLVGDQQPGVGIELHELAGELLEHVIGHDVHRLLGQPGLFHLHAGGGHREGLAGPDGVGEQRVAAAHAPPDGVLLVRVERDALVHAGEIEVRAVEQSRPQIVVGVVIQANQALRCGRDRRRPRSGTAP